MVNKAEKQWSGKSRGGRWGYRFFISIIRLFGVRCAYCFLAFIVIYFIPFAPKATRAIWRYNRLHRRLNIFTSVKELYCHYYVFGQTLIDKIAIRGGLKNRYHYEFDNYERFLDILNCGQGVVMIGAHVGCWEAGAGFFGSYGKKINVVMFDAEYQNIKEVLNDNADEANNYKVIDISHDAIAAMLQIKISLNEGEYICFNGDRFVDKHSTCDSLFMGAVAHFPIGPFRIASKCGAPVVFYYAMRESPYTYRFIFEAPHVAGRVTAQSLVEQYTRSLERIVHQYPRQWFNFYNFWNDRKA